ncbi:MAG TPA: hypothetical protein VFN97_03055 [Actinospica sp.]|nr:hypothetical protein [Actinospica sp.]
MHVLPTPVVDRANPMDFGRSEELIRLGLLQTRRRLAESAPTVSPLSPSPAAATAVR